MHGCHLHRLFNEVVMCDCKKEGQRMRNVVMLLALFTIGMYLASGWYRCRWTDVFNERLYVIEEYIWGPEDSPIQGD